MFGWVWLGGILTGLSIFAYRCQSAELGAAGVHKSSYAQLSKTHTNKRWRYSRIDKEKKRYGDREICMADSRIHSRKEVWYARRVAVVTNESKHTEIRCAINHRLCRVSSVLSPSADIVLLQSRSGPLVASPWRPTRRDSLNVSGHKWYTYHIFLHPYALALHLIYQFRVIRRTFIKSCTTDPPPHRHTVLLWYSRTLLFTHCRLSMCGQLMRPVGAAFVCNWQYQ